MARTTPDRRGPWPGLPPYPPDAVLAVWLDGTLASAVAAGWVARGPNPWHAIAARIDGRPTRGYRAAIGLAHALGREPITLDTPAPFTEPAGWALAHQAARIEDASWLVTGATGASLELAAADAALEATGFGGIWAPLFGEEAVHLARLALALEIPLSLTWDCREESACGICPGCLQRVKAFNQLGMPDPAIGPSKS